MSYTLKDIAKITGKSVSTVSRALNDSSLINQKTKDYIKKVAEELDFEFNSSARNLIKSKTNTIGIIFSNNYYNAKSKTFFSILEKYLFNTIEKNGYEALVQSSANAYTKNSNIKKLINGKKVDALVIATRDITEEDFKTLKKSKIPVIFLYYVPQKSEFLDKTFYIDNIESGALAAEYFSKKQLKKIINITKKTKIETNYLDRTKGFLEEAKRLGLECKTFETGVTFEEGYTFVEKHIDEIKKSDGIFCQQDYGALGILQALRNYDIKVPEEISVLGHDDFKDIISMFQPELSTIKQPFKELCVNAIEYLINILKTEDVNDKDALKISKRKFNAYIVKRSS